MQNNINWFRNSFNSERDAQVRLRNEDGYGNRAEVESDSTKTSPNGTAHNLLDIMTSSSTNLKDGDLDLRTIRIFIWTNSLFTFP